MTTPSVSAQTDVDPIFTPLTFPSGLTIKNRVLRSSISGRFDNYEGSGTIARVNWEERFARGGVGAVLSSHVPVHARGRVLPNYALIDDDDKIPFWRVVGERVHQHGCAFLLQLSYSGRQRDIAGVENATNVALSATSKPDPVHGLPARAMTKREIDEVVAMFGHGARRAPVERATPGSTGWSCTPATAICSRNSSALPSTTAGTSTAGPWRTVPASSSR